MEEQKGLKFLKFEVTKVLFERDDILTGGAKYNINIKETFQTNDNNANLFRSVFVIEIGDAARKVNLQVNAIGYFEIVGNVDAKVRENFLVISAPSIGYPYVRSFISNFTLQSGIGPIMLPPMNFSNLVIKQKQSEPGIEKKDSKKFRKKNIK
jgi:preprotein translocase subunit SecB